MKAPGAGGARDPGLGGARRGGGWTVRRSPWPSRRSGSSRRLASPSPWPATTAPAPAISVASRQRRPAQAPPAEAGHGRVRGWGPHRAGQRVRRRGDEDHLPRRPLVLNGNKMFITQGTMGQVFVVLALTEPGKRQKGITAFVVEKGMPGFSQRAIHGKLGMRSSDTGELILEHVEVPGLPAPRRAGHGLHQHPADPRPRAHHHRHFSTGLARALSRNQPGTRGAARLRQAHRGLRGHPLDAGRHADRPAGRAPPRAPGSGAGRSGAPVRARAWPSCSVGAGDRYLACNKAVQIHRQVAGYTREFLRSDTYVTPALRRRSARAPARCSARSSPASCSRPETPGCRWKPKRWRSRAHGSGGRAAGLGGGAPLQRSVVNPLTRRPVPAVTLALAEELLIPVDPPGSWWGLPLPPWTR